MVAELAQIPTLAAGENEKNLNECVLHPHTTGFEGTAAENALLHALCIHYVL